MKTALRASLLTAFSFVIFMSAKSQTTANHDVSVVITDILTLSLEAGNVSIPMTAIGDYTAGVESGTKKLTVNANKNYKITCYATSAATTSGDLWNGTAAIPLSTLQISANGGTYLALTNSAVTPTSLVSNQPAGAAQATTVKYKSTPGYGHAAGTYTTTVNFTASFQ